MGNGYGQVQETFTYTGANQTWVVPYGVTSVTVKLWGAGGGSSDGSGGSGAFVKGTLAVTPGQTLYIVVGRGGTAGSGAGSVGYGGGGQSGKYGGDGGGYSGIFFTSVTQGNAKAIAGAGGGGGWYGNTTFGGAGGATTGSNGGNVNGSYTGGFGGTLAAGGSQALWNGSVDTDGQAGNALQGGSCLATGKNYGAGGGGGGYYGGGSGYTSSGTSYFSSGGGGGSSYTAGLTGVTNTPGTINNGGNVATAPATGESGYVAGVGNGGAGSGYNAGGHGLVIIEYCPPLTVSTPLTICEGTSVVLNANVKSHFSYYQPFDNCTGTNCGGWTITGGYSPGYNYGYYCGISGAANSNIYGSSTDTYLTSNSSLFITDGSPITLDFTYGTQNYGGGNTTAGYCTINVQWSSDGSTWNTIESFSNVSNSNCNPHTTVFSPPANSNIYIRFHSHRTNGDFWIFIDDISIKGFTPPSITWSNGPIVSGGNTLTPLVNPTTTTTYKATIPASGTCPAVTKDVVVNVIPTLNEGTISVDQDICKGTAPSQLIGTTPTGGGGGYTYQWQSSPNEDGPWTNVSGATGKDYQPGSLTQDTYYRRQVNSATCGSAFSTTILSAALTSTLKLHYTFDEQVEPSQNLIPTNIAAFKDFENWTCTDAVPTDVTRVLLPGQGYQGRDAVKITKNASATGGYFQVQLGFPTSGSAGTTYTASVKYQQQDATTNFAIGDWVGPDGDIPGWTQIADIDLGGGWRQRVVRITYTNAQTAGFTFGINSTTPNKWLIFSDFQLEKSDHVTPFVVGTNSPVTASDHSGNNNHGSLVLATTPEWISGGHDGGAYKFDNIGKRTVGKGKELSTMLSGNKYTWSAWVNRASSINAYNMFMGQHLPYFNFNSSNRFFFSASIGGVQKSVQGATTLNNNEWYLYTATYDGTDMKIYVNGVLDGVLNAPGTMTWSPTYDFAIGDGHENAVWYPFNGKVDDVRIYNSALTASQIQELYESTSSLRVTVREVSPTPVVTQVTPVSCTDPATLSSTTLQPIAYYKFDGDLKDYSGNNLHLTQTGTTAAAYSENGLKLTLGTQFLSPNNSFFSDNSYYTIDFDFKQTDLNDDGGLYFSKIFTWDPVGDRAPGIFGLNTGKGFHWRHSSTGSPIANAGIDDGTLNLNQWYHITGVRKGTVFEYYVDGVLVHTATLPADNRTGRSPFIFGAYGGNKAPKGTILKNFKIYDRAIEWHESSCTGTLVASTPTVEVNPTATTTYYAKIVSPCGTTACGSSTVTRDVSTPPTSATNDGISNAYCNGDPITLTSNGGTNGTGAVDVWYAATGELATDPHNGCNENFIELWNGFSYNNPSYYYDHRNTDYTVNNGIISVKNRATGDVGYEGGDPHLWMFPLPGNQTIDADVYKYVNVRYKITNLQGTYTTPRIGVLWTKTPAASSYTPYPWPGDFARKNLINDGQWHVVSIPAYSGTNWNGTITGLRLDYFDPYPDNGNDGSKMDIDFVTVSKFPMVGEGKNLTLTSTDEYYPAVGSTTTFYTKKIDNCGATSCQTTTITIDAKPTLPTSITVDNNTNNCWGREIKLTETDGVLQGASQYIYGTSLGGTELNTGTTSTTQTTVPTGSATYYVGVTANGACPAQNLSTGITVNLPSKTATLSSSEAATCYVSGTNPIHFYNTGTGHYIGSINPQGRTGTLTMTSYAGSVGDNTMYSCNSPTAPQWRTAFMKRSFTVIPTGSITGTGNLDVYFPFSATEYSSLQTESINTTTGNVADNVNALTDLVVTKYSNPGSENGTPYDNCSVGVSSVIGQNGYGGTLSYGVSPAITASYIRVPVSSFSEFYLHGQNNASPLPITLTSFSGNCEKDGVHLAWVTATETNVNRFEVKRSRDGQTWEVVASVNAVGNSSTANSYQVIDASEFDLMYYRLTSIDNDGSRETFNPVSVVCEISKDSWSIYPIPVSTKATVTINATTNSQGTLVVSDINGRTISSQNVQINKGVNNYELDVHHLSEGTYFIRLEGSSTYKPLKFVKIN